SSGPIDVFVITVIVGYGAGSALLLCGHSRSWRSARAPSRSRGPTIRAPGGRFAGLMPCLRGAHRVPPDRNRARSCGSHCRGERVHVVGAPVPLPVDEEAGCAGHTARVRARNILVDAPGISTPPKLVPEAVDVEP